VRTEANGRTRKQRREQARLQRRALERAEAARMLRRKRVRLLGIVSTLVTSAIVLVLIASAGATKKLAPGSAQSRRAVSDVTTMLRELPQSGNALGEATAPVTLQYFGDLECPVCRSFSSEALPSIVAKWVRAGKLRIEYRSLQTATREPEVFAAQQLAALAAGEQDKLWNFVETFYREQGEEGSGYVTETFIRQVARQVPGLDLTRWATERGNSALAGQVVSDAQAANASDLGGTPAFLIGMSGGQMSRLEPSSFTDSGSFDQAISRRVHSAAQR
jgi:protein-disulfide isomerase